MNYYVTQFPTDHGCVKKYLHIFGQNNFPICPNPVDEEENAEYILTYCPRFKRPGEMSLEPNRLMEELLNCRVLWSQYSQRMAGALKTAERRRNLTKCSYVIKFSS